MEQQPKSDVAAQLAAITRQLETLPQRIGEATDRRTSFEKMMASMAEDLGKVSPEEERRMLNARDLIENTRQSRTRANLALVISTVAALAAVAGVIVAIAGG